MVGDLDSSLTPMPTTRLTTNGVLGVVFPPRSDKTDNC
jgi:hypothetical protein